MVQFPRSKAWRVSIVVVPLIVIMGIYNANKPRRIVDSRIFGTWVDRDGTKIDFRQDGKLLITRVGRENWPVGWWIDDKSTMHVLHPDEDAAAWVLIPFEFKGNDQLHLDNKMYFDLPTDLVRVRQ